MKQKLKKEHLFWLVLMVAFGVRLAYLFEISNYPDFDLPPFGIDEELYDNAARQIAQGIPLSHNESLPFASSPLYAYWLGALYAVFGSSYWVARVANVVLGVATVAVLYLCVQPLFSSTRIALVAALGASLYAPYIVFDTGLLKVSLGQFLMVIALWCVTRAEQKQQWLLWLVAGAVTGLGIKVYGQMKTFLLVLCVWLCVERVVRFFRYRRIAQQETGVKPWCDVAALASGAALALMPFLVVDSCAGTGKNLDLLASVHLAIGNHGSAEGGYDTLIGVRSCPAGNVVDAKRVAEEKLGRTLSTSEVSAYWRQQAVRFIREEPAEFTRLMGKKILMLLNSYEHICNKYYDYRRQISPYLSIFPGASFLLPLGLAGLLLAICLYRTSWPLIVLFFSHALTVCLGFVTWRYRLPLTLLLWPLAAFFLVRLMAWARTGKVLSVVLSCLVLYGSWHLSQLPLERDRHGIYLWWESHRMTALQWEKELLRQLTSPRFQTKRLQASRWIVMAQQRAFYSDYETACVMLKRAVALSPDQLLAWQALYFLHSHFGETKQAEECKEKIEALGAEEPNKYSRAWMVYW